MTRETLLRCSTCIHNSESECHRFPPQVTVVLIPQRHALSGQTQIVPTPIACWPQVPNEGMCGEYVGKTSLQLAS